jgi:hypothetical protein
MKRYNVDGFICCGHQPPTEADFAAVAKLKRYLAGEMQGAELREYVGLTAGQVSKLTGITRAAILADEDVSEELCETDKLRLKKLYAGDMT